MRLPPGGEPLALQHRQGHQLPAQPFIAAHAGPPPPPTFPPTQRSFYGAAATPCVCHSASPTQPCPIVNNPTQPVDTQLQDTVRETPQEPAVGIDAQMSGELPQNAAPHGPASSTSSPKKTVSESMV